MNKWKYYFKSFRLRTLPLSLSGVIAGALIAGSYYFVYPGDQSVFSENNSTTSITSIDTTSYVIHVTYDYYNISHSALWAEMIAEHQLDSFPNLKKQIRIIVTSDSDTLYAMRTMPTPIPRELTFDLSDIPSCNIEDYVKEKIEEISPRDSIFMDDTLIIEKLKIKPNLIFHIEQSYSDINNSLGFSFTAEISSHRGKREFNIGVFIFAILTTLCLQILSNLSNDYGDMKRGTDNEDRLGPKRSLQIGELTMEDMKRGIIVFALLSALFGFILVCIALGSNYPWGTFFMLLIGALAIIGAVKYTVGKGAYGYYGLGDLGVLIFFGLVSTVCTYYLMCEGIFWEAYILLPAFSIGLFSVGVLNLNNMRDIENDAKFGKRTLPVRFGEEWAKKYHRILIYVGLLCAFIFAILCRNHGRSFLFLLTVPFFLVHLRRVRNASGAELDSELRYLSLSTFVFAFLIGLGQLL